MNVLIMLGEGFLHVLNYTKDDTSLDKQKTYLHTVGSPKFKATPQQTVRSSQTRQTPQVNRFEGVPRPCLTSGPSKALAIPSSSAEDDWSTKPCKSVVFPSLYQAYPDLQLAGDTLAPQFSLNQNHFTPQAIGPLLISQDLGSMKALEEPENQADAIHKVNESYLVIENARSPGSDARLTNSMLNSYLETQLMEVYRQHMQDNLARCSPSSINANVPQICAAELNTSGGHSESWVRGLNSGTTQNNSVRYLSTCSAQCTTNFSSPVLRISNNSE